VRPPVPFFGSKQSVASWIVSQLPAHEHYVEPFCGSLAVLLAKPPSRMETVNDLDAGLQTFWRILRDEPDALLRQVCLTPHSRAEFEAARKPADSDLETARRVWVRLTQSRSATLRKTGWRHYIDPAGCSASMPDYLDGYRDRLAACAERLMRVSLECRPALEVIAAYGSRQNVLLMCDPPYLGSTRGWGNNYRVEMKTEEEHRNLAEALWECSATVVLCGYASPLYEGWHRAECSSTTGNATPGTQSRTEVLWSNRPFAGQGQLWEAGAA
jgi:DNA adenine methylase